RADLEVQVEASPLAYFAFASQRASGCLNDLVTKVQPQTGTESFMLSFGTNLKQAIQFFWRHAGSSVAHYYGDATILGVGRNLYRLRSFREFDSVMKQIANHMAHSCLRNPNLRKIFVRLRIDLNVAQLCSI